MGLGIPGEVVSVTDTRVVIECWGVRRVADFAMSGEVIVAGDFVIEEEGIIVRRVPPEEVDRTIELYETVLVEA